MTASDFELAMNQVVPASRRGLVAPRKPIQKHLRPLLADSLDEILRKLPKGYLPEPSPHVVDGGSSNQQLQQVVAALQPRPVVPGGNGTVHN